MSELQIFQEALFYNVTIDAAANLLMQTGSTMKIGGVMNNVFGAAWDNLTTVRVGAKCCNSYASTNRYSSLILSGSGVKTMPSRYVYFRI
jgi:hypothetical protein